MQVIKRRSGYLQDPTRYFDFERFKEKTKDFVLIEAAFEQATLWSEFGIDEKALQKLRKKKIVRLEFSEPDKFYIGDNPDNYDSDFYRVFTICPYTAEWLNKKNKTKKRVPIFYPFNENFIPKKQKKQFDIIYTGHIVGKKILQDVVEISTFNYRFVSNSENKLVTNKAASHEEKMDLIARSKITLVHNLLYPKQLHIMLLWLNPDYHNNEAFKQIPKRFNVIQLLRNNDIHVPQLKSRLFEAAFGRSLILCKKDKFNVVENFFKPGKEFIYYEDGTLKSTVQKILSNYKDYTPMIERAFNRASKNYTTKAFFEKYLKNLY
jgi:hypothetical protein